MIPIFIAKVSLNPIHQPWYFALARWVRVIMCAVNGHEGKALNPVRLCKHCEPRLINDNRVVVSYVQLEKEVQNGRSARAQS